MGARLKMKDLEAATGVGRETIRYYIREGMLPEPERPRRNVAWYGDDHVLRIRAIKRLQEERFLPLAAIRELMASADIRALAEGRGAEIAALLPEMLGEATDAPRAGLETVSSETGLDRDELAQLVERGIVEADADGTLDARDVEICRLWGRVRAAGYRAADGFDIDHLQRYQDLTTWLAGIEVDLFLHSLGSRLDQEQAAERGAEGLLLGNALLGALRVRAALRALSREDVPPRQ